MGIRNELDELLANPEYHAILVNALGECGSPLDRNADEIEMAHIEQSIAHVDALRDVFERWLCFFGISVSAKPCNCGLYEVESHQSSLTRKGGHHGKLDACDRGSVRRVRRRARLVGRSGH